MSESNWVFVEEESRELINKDKKRVFYHSFQSSEEHEEIKESNKLETYWATMCVFYGYCESYKENGFKIYCLLKYYIVDWSNPKTVCEDMLMNHLKVFPKDFKKFIPKYRKSSHRIYKKFLSSESRNAERNKNYVYPYKLHDVLTTFIGYLLSDDDWEEKFIYLCYLRCTEYFLLNYVKRFYDKYKGSLNVFSLLLNSRIFIK